MNTVVFTALEILFGAVGLYLAFCVTLLFGLAVAGLFYRSKKRTLPADPERSFLVMIPAYREDAVILATLEAARGIDYPAEKYDIQVIAQHLKPETVARLRDLGALVTELNVESSTKVKALKAGAAALARSYDGVVILDADNHPKPDLLRIADAELAAGRRAIQGHRAAKNTDTRTAWWDAVSEEMNHHLQGKGPAVLGLSGRLAGSGMVFDGKLFFDYLPKLEAIGGFDKELALYLNRDRIWVDYVEAAVVWDEKVASEAVFQKQRQRWLAAQYQFLAKHALGGLKGFFTGNWHYALQVAWLALPPRILVPVLTAGGAALSWLTGIYPYAWTVLFIAATLAYAFSIPRPFWNRHMLAMLGRIPALIWRTLIALTGMKEARKRFIHTPHQS